MSEISNPRFGYLNIVSYEDGKEVTVGRYDTGSDRSGGDATR